MTGLPQWLIVLQIVTPVVVAVIGWLIKRAIAQMDARQDSADRRIEKLEENAVSKEEWLRESGIQRIKLDELARNLAELKGQNQAGVEIGAAIAAALNRRPA